MLGWGKGGTVAWGTVMTSVGLEHGEAGSVGFCQNTTFQNPIYILIQPYRVAADKLSVSYPILPMGLNFAEK